MTRPGDLVYCIATMGDPRKDYQMIGLQPPTRGCVYTVSAVVPGMSGEDTYILEEAGSKYTDKDGETVLITWQAKCFRPARRHNVAHLLNVCLSTLTRAQVKEYGDEWKEIVREAEKHRKAKY